MNRISKQLLKISRWVYSNYNGSQFQDLQVGQGYIEQDGKIIFKADIPDYAITYLVNGDESGFDDEEELQLIKDWQKDNKVEIVDPTNQHDEFNPSPQFGKPCSTTVCFVWTRK